MIYAFPKSLEPIRQGDLFFPLPLIVLGMQNVPVLARTGAVCRKNWLDIQGEERTVIQASVKRCWGIVASQDCDAVRAPSVSVFLIDHFEKVTGLQPASNPAKTDQWWMKAITLKSRVNLKWFYLPPDDRVGFPERMAVDFQIVFQVEREYLVENMSVLRKGRLNEVAYEHYRENMAQFFRRYPYNEWYPLSKGEFRAYAADKPDSEAYDWQRE